MNYNNKHNIDDAAVYRVLPNVNRQSRQSHSYLLYLPSWPKKSHKYYEFAAHVAESCVNKSHKRLLDRTTCDCIRFDLVCHTTTCNKILFVGNCWCFSLYGFRSTAASLLRRPLFIVFTIQLFVDTMPWRAYNTKNFKHHVIPKTEKYEKEEKTESENEEQLQRLFHMWNGCKHRLILRLIHANRNEIFTNLSFHFVCLHYTDVRIYARNPI